MAQFRIDQATQGTPGEARHDLVSGQVITLVALDPAPGPGVTHTWEIIDKVGSLAELTATTGATVDIGSAGGLITQPCGFKIRLTADDNGTITVVERVASVRTASAGLRYPMFGELAPFGHTIGSNDPIDSTDNATYADLAGLGSAAQNWRSYAEWGREMVDAIEGATAGGPPTGAAGGDLTGSYPNPTVAALRATPLQAALNPNDGEALVWVDPPGEWQAQVVAAAGQIVGGTNVLSTGSDGEVVFGGLVLDPNDYLTSTLTLQFFGVLTVAGAGVGNLYLYDLGAPGSPEAAVLRATATIPNGDAGAHAVVEVGLTVQASPGTDADQIWNVERMYELRIELSGGDVNDTLLGLWGGIKTS